MPTDELGFPVKKVREGLAEVLVPAEEVRAPKKASVFYNPVMALNRDVAVLALRASTTFMRTVVFPTPGRPVRKTARAEPISFKAGPPT